MSRIVLIVLAALVVLLLVGLGFTWLSRSRDAANHAGCANNLRALALLGAPYSRAGGNVMTVPDAVKPASVWPGTVIGSAATPDERLSWVALALPTFHEPGLNPGDLARSLELKSGWNAPPNREAGTQVLRTLICPGYVPPIASGEPAPTMYVGVAGLGANAAALSRTEPLSPEVGAFDYDSATPLELIIAHDGVSQTLLYGQTNHRLSPWIRGGYSTVRGMEDSPAILAPSGGQFGGTLADGAYFAFCDGSAKLFRYGTDPAVLKQLATIAGGKTNFE